MNVNKTTQIKKLRIPKLRFDGFKDAWEEKKLSDVFSKNQERNSNNKHSYVLTNSAIEGIVSQLDYFDKDIANHDNLTNYFVVDVDDFIYNPRISKYAPVGPLKRNNLAKGIMSPLYTVLRMKQGDVNFFEKYFSTSRWYGYMYKIANYGARHDRMNISQDDFLKMPLPFPSLLEQNKIVEFLEVVDSWIENLKLQKSSFQSYKKGIAKNIFSQEISFKDINGDNFPEWIECKIGDYLEYEQPTNYIVESTEYSNFYKIPVLTAGKSFILGYTNEKDGIFKKDLPVIIFDDFTTASQFVDFPFKVKSSAMKILKAKNNINIKFIYEVMQSTKCEVGGHGRHWISKYSNIKILVPSLIEQQRIADFLMSIDKVIESKQQQISQVEDWKKGLIQGLFV